MSWLGIRRLGDAVLLGSLKGILAGGQHQCVAVGDVRQGLNGGAFVNDTRIVQQQHRPRLMKREALALRPMGIENPRFSADDVVSVQ
jgi:hypothetical protein